MLFFIRAYKMKEREKVYNNMNAQLGWKKMLRGEIKVIAT